jgi:4-hydroxy-tetrahydrodipicolinate synthase
MMEKIRGIYTALCTPVSNGKINGEAMGKLVDFVIENGTAGLVALGGTGEYCALSNEQRVEALRVTIAANRGRVPVVAGIIGPGLPETIEMGNKCKDLGVDAIMVVTPYYVVSSQQGIYDYYRQVMKNVNLPLILYNIPYRTGVNMLPETVERLLDNDDKGQIVGMKECCPNMGQVLELLSKVKDRTSVLTGEEFLFFQEVSCGAQGGILATSNLLPRLWTDLFDLIQAGELGKASEIVIRVTPLLRLIFAESNPGPLKEAMKMIGMDCGDPLLPLLKPSSQLVESLEIELKKLLAWYK